MPAILKSSWDVLGERGKTSSLRAPRELEIALNAPVGPQRLAEDTIVIDTDGWYRTLTASSSWPAANEVLFSNLDQQDPDGHIDRIVNEYHSLGLPLTWCVYPWTQPLDLGARLLARGATQSVIFAFLCSTSHPLQPVDDVEVGRIDAGSAKDYETYIDVMSAGNNLPASEIEFRRRRYYQLSTGPRPCMQLFLARHKGVVAGCHAVVIKEDSAHFTGANVLSAFRAHGVFQSLIAASLRAMHERDIPLVTGHSNEKSAPWVKRFGFRPIYSYDIFQLDSPQAGGASL